jgi:uncharacterized protein (TIGR03435 family)
VTVPFGVCGLLGALTIAAVYGQENVARPAFEVASIKPSPPASPGYDLITDQMYDSLPFAGVPINPSGTRVTLRRYSLLRIIASAYGVRTLDVSAPSWTAEKRFDIDALLPKGAPSRLVDEMMQSLLKERFALQVHEEKRRQDVLALLVGKEGPRLRPNTTPNPASAEPGASPAMPSPPDRGIPERAAGAVRWAHRTGATMEDLAHTLSSFLGARVVDMTKLEGRYDFSLTGFGGPSVQDDGTGPSILDAVKDLGLRLEKRQAEVSVLVVDSVAKEPTAN